MSVFSGLLQADFLLLFYTVVVVWSKWDLRRFERDFVE